MLVLRSSEYNSMAASLEEKIAEAERRFRVLYDKSCKDSLQFSLDRNRRSHRQNRCSASGSVGLIFTRSYRSTLLITTPTMTPLQVKTSLKNGDETKHSPGASCG